MAEITYSVRAAVELLVVLIFVDAVIWNIIAFGGRIPTRHPVVRGIHSVVEPILNPIRKVLPPRKTGNLDLAPLIAIIALQWLVGALLH